MKETIQKLLLEVVDAWSKQQGLTLTLPEFVPIERTRDKQHGDFASNLALLVAKQARMAPRALAETWVALIPLAAPLLKVEVAGPGFINFFLQAEAISQVVHTVIAEGARFGACDLGKNQSVILEFVSANPTGPLHVGHGRGAAFSASLANLLETVGYRVHREYYVNDAGRQMDILALSVWLRYLEAKGAVFNFPENAYRGDYVRTIAEELLQKYPSEFAVDPETVFVDLPPLGETDRDKDNYVDTLIARAKSLLGDAHYAVVHAYGLDGILADIRDDLAEFGVHYQEWFHESSLVSSGAVERAVAALQQGGHCYEREGALWFNAMHFGDEKDRVLQRANGAKTYFAADVAYHLNKFERKFDRLIDVFGADHHGYVTRVKASCSALGYDANQVEVLLVQFAVLWRGDEKVKMSTRSGEFVTLRELRREVGNDAARFFYVMRKPDQHMDFDLELAKSQSADNPVYYIQYAHARICSVLAQAQEKHGGFDAEQGLAHLSLLTNEHEIAVLTSLNHYPELIQHAGLSHEPHQLTYYLRTLANHFHTYYNAHQFLIEPAELRNARLCLVRAVQIVIRNGLAILGVSAPETM